MRGFPQLLADDAQLRCVQPKPLGLRDINLDARSALVLPTGLPVDDLPSIQLPMEHFTYTGC